MSEESERAIHRSATNNHEEIMNTTPNTADEQTNDYHVLPGLIGEAIIHPDYGTHHSGRYLVRRRDNDTISVYRVVDHAPTRDDLDAAGDYIADMGEYVAAGEESVEISAPGDGWESDTIPESIFEGYE
jgi:hypothetical protein